jgi:hypothetical protein
MLLSELQALLARIYDLELEADVCDFLITDPRELRRWHAESAHRGLPEALLVQERADSLAVALYLDSALLERLRRSAPLERLGAHNLEDFCTALEGVSHFACVAWMARAGRSVSLLGLEVQADIDKYTISVLLAGQQAGGTLARGLHAQLFDRVHYRDDLDRGARRLYESANRYAARFCRQLEDRFLRPRRARVEAMLGELRRFYRLSDAGKLRAIEAA